MGRLLQILLIIIFLYYLFRLLAGFVFPFLIKYLIGKRQVDFNNRENGYQQRHRKKEGEINIDYYPPKADKNRHGADNKNKNNEGEYVDFEEVE